MVKKLIFDVSDELDKKLRKVKKIEDRSSRASVVRAAIRHYAQEILKNGK